MKTPRPLAVFAATAAAACAWAGDPIQMDLRNTFRGPDQDLGVVTVDLHNDGPDARGTLRVLGAKGGAAYPVDLPRGASRSVVTYNGASRGLPLQFVLETNQGREVQRWSSFSSDLSNGAALLLVSDNPRELPLSKEHTDRKRSFVGVDATVLPMDAPPRALAYRSFGTVILGSGAGRLGDATVAALKEYALAGGTLVFSGGKSAGALNDPRWANALPGSGWRTRRDPSQTDGAPIRGLLLMVEPRHLASGGEGSNLATEWGWGLGRVMVFDFSPLPYGTGRAHTSKDSINGAPAVLTHSVSISQAHEFVDSYLNRTVSRSGSFEHVGYGSGYNSGTTDQIQDPFQTKLPPSGTVFGLLAGYFVLVVPASFLVLRRLRRGELAWVTAPLLSLGFAGALFGSAQGLYAAKLSTASQGVLVMQEGSPDALFFGTSQMFFPRGGSYDLRMRGIESLDAVGNDEEFGSNALAGFNPVDVGHIEVPKLEASSLAFREMSYSQKVEGGDWFRIHRLDAHHTRVENRSPYAFRGALLIGNGTTERIVLGSGEAKTVDTTHRARLADEKTKLAPENPLNFTRYTGRVALAGSLTGFRPGPQVGSEVHNDVAMVAFGQERTQ